jgi:hypothetical protein
MPRYTYLLQPVKPGHCCVLTGECERIARAVGATTERPDTLFSSDRFVPPASLDNAEVKVTVIDQLENAGQLIVSVAQAYPSVPIARLRELGLLPALP